MKHHKHLIIQTLVALVIIKSIVAAQYCCPAFYQINRENICQSVEDVSRKENIPEDLYRSCKGRLIQISSSLVDYNHNYDLIYNRSYLIPNGEYCYGTATGTNDDIHLICDVCTHGDCVQTCCPPGQIYADDPSWKAPRCSDGSASSPQKACVDAGYNFFHKNFYHSGKTFNLTGNTGYYEHFSCPESEDEGVIYSLVGALLYYQKYFLNMDGDLVASHPDGMGGDVVHKFDKSQFCLIYNQVNTSGVAEADLDVTFRFCHKEKKAERRRAIHIYILPRGLIGLCSVSLPNFNCLHCGPRSSQAPLWKNNSWFRLQ